MSPRCSETGVRWSMPIRGTTAGTGRGDPVSRSAAGAGASGGTRGIIRGTDPGARGTVRGTDPVGVMAGGTVGVPAGTADTGMADTEGMEIIGATGRITIVAAGSAVLLAMFPAGRRAGCVTADPPRRTVTAGAALRRGAVEVPYIKAEGATAIRRFTAAAAAGEAAAAITAVRGTTTGTIPTAIIRAVRPPVRPPVRAEATTAAVRRAAVIAADRAAEVHRAAVRAVRVAVVHRAAAGDTVAVNRKFNLEVFETI